MGLFDKIKDLFMDEVTDDEEIELEEDNKNTYQEPKDVLPKVMRDTIEKEEEGIKFEELKPINKDVLEKEESVPSRKFSFPIDMDDSVIPSRSSNVNVLKVEKEAPKRVSELYSKKDAVLEKPKFRPTPVISPVYGILDKNYTKEEVREKAEDNFEMKRPSKKVDFETVRKKAFGNLTDDIKDNLMCENCELYKEVKRISAISSDDLLYDMTVDDEKKDEPVTIEKAYDNYEDFGVAYEPKREDVVDSNSKTIINNNTEVNIASEIVIEDPKQVDSDLEKDVIDDEGKIPSRQDKKRENKVDEDFFELIDSMYKERIDE